MATYRKRNNRWDVQIRRSGQQTLYRTFTHKKDAQYWATEAERDIERGVSVPQKSDVSIMLKDLLHRYGNEISIHKKGVEQELSRIKQMQRYPICSLPISGFTAQKAAQYMDQRLELVKPGTVSRELSILSNVLEIARREWGFPVKNVIREIRKPSLPPGRSRRLLAGEEARILKECSRSKYAAYLTPLVLVALETAMRRGELLSLRWNDTNLDTQVAYLATTKNGDHRYVPLSTRAVTALLTLPIDIKGNVFSIKAWQLRGHWDRACQRAGVENLRFHDLRHEATSRFFEKGLNVMEVAAITGHNDLRMLQRYTHLRAEDLAKKLG
jgi:integrase